MDSKEYQILKSLKCTVGIITSERGGLSIIAREHCLNGTFKQLCNNKLFAELCFPGTSKVVLDELPKNLKEILEWKELKLDMTKIAKNAVQVLENIQIKGRRQGDIMDEATEKALIPQIAQEALAQGIIECVRSLSRKVSQISAKMTLNVASITSEKAQLDQLEEEVVHNLIIDFDKMYGVQCDYMGHEWAQLIRKDIIRFMEIEKMTLMSNNGTVVTKANISRTKLKKGPPTSSTDSDSIDDIATTSHQQKASMCWIESNNSMLSGKYPALLELVSQLHALPFELNCKFLLYLYF